MKGVRENYYVFLALSGIWMLAVGFIGPIVIPFLVFPVFVISAVVIAVVSYRFRCVWCDHPLVSPKMTVGTVQMNGYTSFPGKTCTNCGKDVSGD